MQMNKKCQPNHKIRLTFFVFCGKISLVMLMSVKEKVLKILMESEFAVSGESLAKECGVSRNAVWKAVNSLKSEGYDILGVNKSGYILRRGDVLSLDELKCLLGDRLIEVYDTIGSTNTRAKELATLGAESGSIVISDEQTVGRGRFDRRFESKRGNGLYISIILRPDIPMSESMRITAYAAVAAARAIESFGVKDIKIKWVNDLYLSGKKICGILTEGSWDLEGGRMEYAVVGIGINLGDAEFSGELKGKASSVYSETGIKIPRCALAAEIVRNLENTTEEYMEEYRSRSCVIGKKVRVNNGNDCFEAQILGIDENGFLIAKKDENLITVNAGEVVMK